MTYTYNAVWLLQSIFNAENSKVGGADLRDVISVADYIERAVMTYAEFSSGAELLLKLKLIHQDGVTLRTSVEFKQWYEATFKNVKRPFPHKEKQEMEKYVRELTQATTGDPDVKIFITAEDLSTAVQRYRSTF